MPFDLLVAARDLVAIDSRSSVSDRPVVDFLAPLCTRAGLTVTVQEEPRDGLPQYNLLAWRGEPRADALLLATHLDTVPPGDPALWTATGGTPFSLTLREGLLYGLGAADVKLDFLCKLAALERLQQEPLQRPVLLAGTYGEETGRWGAKLLVRALRPLPRLALVGEPSGLRPTTAHKGYVEFRLSAETPARPCQGRPLWSLTFTGRAAHSSQPHVGTSANDACLDLLIDLAHAGRLAGGTPDAVSGPDPADPATVRLVAVEGGDLINRVAGSCRLVLCAARRPDVTRVGGVTVAVSPCEPDAADTHETTGGPAHASNELTAMLLRIRAATRWLEGELRRRVADGFEPPWSTVSNGILRLEGGRLEYAVDVRSVPPRPAPADAAGAAQGDSPLDSLLDEYERRLKESCAGGGCTAEVRRLLEAPPFLAARDSATLGALMETLRSLGLPTGPELKSGTTEASVYQEAGLDVVVFGPGEAQGNIHRPNEHVPVAHLERAVDVYADVITRLCGSAGRV